ncbi:MAG: glycosyltransferase family 4 protein [Rhodospirillaceae bacterium]|nr:glycosyltransferase family 4 protein [Rhodospirillaceae bacterium]
MGKPLPVDALAAVPEFSPARPARVLHLMQCTNLGGMEQVACRLMDRLGRTYGTQFRVATPRRFGPGGALVKAHDPQAQDFDYRGKYGWRSHGTFAAHVRRIAEGCDAAWVTGADAASMRALRPLPIRKLMRHHYHHFEGRLSWVKWRGFYELLCRDIEAIFYVCDFARREALRIAPWLEPKAFVVQNGFPRHYAGEEERLRRRRAAREALGLPQDAWIVGNGGWLIRRKRFDVFLRVAAEVRRQLPEAWFVICGGGELEAELKALAAALGIADRVRFAGWVTDLTPYHEAWDVCLFSSDFDAIPTTPIEAASHGALVVASVVHGGLDEFIEHERNGFLLAAHDVPRMADAVVRLAREPALASAWRRAAAQTLVAKYDPAAKAAQFQDFFARGRLPAN